MPGCFSGRLLQLWDGIHQTTNLKSHRPSASFRSDFAVYLEQVMTCFVWRHFGGGNIALRRPAQRDPESSRPKYLHEVLKSKNH